MRQYETYDHGADIGIRGYGNSVEEAFENGARAMFSVLVDMNEVKPADVEHISCDAPDIEMLFVEWLNSLLSISHLTGKFFSDFRVEIAANKLKGSARGERYDMERHHVLTEVKAATYSTLKVTREDDIYIAQCIVDV